MPKTIRTFFLSFTILAFLLFSTVGTTTVLADDGTGTEPTATETAPPTEEEQPAQPVTDVETPPADDEQPMEPVVEETPTPGEEPQPTEPVVEETQPAEETAPAETSRMDAMLLGATAHPEVTPGIPEQGRPREKLFANGAQEGCECILIATPRQSARPRWAW